ncbi:MAG: chromate transporter [Clostridia bacterium]|nr:chromate transporter [Clostridia bacterium]
MKMLSSLFFQFLKFGAFTFGGGWSLIAQMQKEFVEKRKLITNEELLDLTSVGRSIPGTMIGNTAMLFGYREAGFLGGLVCLVGMTLAPFLILTAVTFFYNALLGSFIMDAVMKGIRAAVVPIILSAVLGLMKSGYRYPVFIVCTVISFVLYAFFNVNCIYLVVIGMILGVLITEICERKEKANGR